jgi:integrase
MSAGIYPLASGGFRVVACIGRGTGKRRETRFPAGTAMRKMQRWQEDARRDLRDQPTVEPGSLAADVAVYLPIKQATMPRNGFKERTRLMGLWLAALGPHRHRGDIQPVQVRSALAAWEANGCDGGAGPWSKGSSNRARTALMDFYSVMGGKSGYNPVRDVKRHREHRKPKPRIDYPTLARVLAAMPDQGQGRKGETRREISQTKARVNVIAYTGWPHATIMRLEPEHIDWADRLVLIKGRRKGEGTPDRWLPVSRAGLDALIDFADADAWGEFSPSSMRISVRRAFDKLGIPSVTPYKLRHLFGTTVMRANQNRSSASDLLIHTSEKTTRIYTEDAELPVLRAALDAFDANVVGPRCGLSLEAVERTSVSRTG